MNAAEGRGALGGPQPDFEGTVFRLEAETRLTRASPARVSVLPTMVLDDEGDCLGHCT